MMSIVEDRLHAEPGRPSDVQTARVAAEEQEHAIDEITVAIKAKLRERVRRGETITDLGSAEDVAALVIDRLPLASSPWAELIGPCYTSGSLQQELEIGRAAISKAVKELRLLRLETADGHTIYPAFQIKNRAPVRGLQDVLKALSAGISDEWTWAQWLNARTSDEHGGAQGRPGVSNIDRLIAGDVAGVVRSAERTAASWAS